MNDSLRGLVTQLMARWVPRGVSDDLLHIVDPVGGFITVSLRYCHDYAVSPTLSVIPGRDFEA
jgi:hypothetical protein